MDGVQLSQGYRANTKRQLRFTTKSAGCLGTRLINLRRMSQTWIYPVGLNLEPLDWKFSALTAKSLLC